MTVSIQFVHVSNASGGQPGALSAGDQRAIRSQAMRDFRRRQRETARASFQIDTGSAAATPGQQRNPATRNLPKAASEEPKHFISIADDHEHGQTNRDQPLPSDTSGKHTPFSCCIRPDASHDVAKQPGRTENCCHNCQRIKQFLAQRTLPIPQAIRSPATIRGPMLQSFIEGFYPSCIWSDPKMIGVLSKWAIARSQATLHINDAVGLTQVGLASHDQRLVMEGRKRHVLAVSTLRREINDSTSPIEIISSAVISMMMAEIFSATSSGLAGCATHLAGVTAVLHAHLNRPDTRPVDNQVLRQYHRLILMQGLIHRKAISLEKELFGNDIVHPPGSTEALIHIGLGLPAVLETTDSRLRAQEDRNEQASRASLSVISIALGLGRDLDAWLQDFRKDIFRYRLAPLKLRSSVDGNVLGLYWSMRLLLAESLFYLHTLVTPTRISRQAVQLAKNEASMYASLLRETAVALESFKGTRLSQAIGMRAPLHFAKQWWSRVRNKGQVQAIETIESELKADLPGIEWTSLLYWSFMAASWLG